MTVYLVGISTVVACAIGIPVGVLAARSQTADRIVTVIVDTLQTIPAFVYLIPAVMLFRVGDVSAMIGIILYAITPAIRYTNHGIRQVPEEMVEAAKVSGCTGSQLLWRVQIPLALPEIMLGINQVVMLALALDINAPLNRTRRLGQGGVIFMGQNGRAEGGGRVVQSGWNTVAARGVQQKNKKK